MILVTGATGLIGRGLVAQLVAAGAGVRALSRSPETVEDVIGRPARTFAQWASDHAAEFQKVC